jgi:hypothetical protein
VTKYKTRQELLEAIRRADLARDLVTYKILARDLALRNLLLSGAALAELVEKYAPENEKDYALMMWASNVVQIRKDQP